MPTVRGIAETLSFEEGALKRAIESMEKQIESLEKACAREKAQKRAQAAELDKLKGEAADARSTKLEKDIERLEKQN